MTGVQTCALPISKNIEFGTKVQGTFKNSIGELLNGKLREHILNLSMNLADEERKKFNETIDFNSTILLQRNKKNWIFDRDTKKNGRKSLSIRRKELINPKSRRKNDYKAKKQIFINTSILPSSMLREDFLNSTSHSPTYECKPYSKPIFNKTCKLKRKPPKKPLQMHV